MAVVVGGDKGFGGGGLVLCPNPLPLTPKGEQHIVAEIADNLKYSFLLKFQQIL
jgi:hypothetical protein